MILNIGSKNFKLYHQDCIDIIT